MSSGVNWRSVPLSGAFREIIIEEINEQCVIHFIDADGLVHRIGMNGWNAQLVIDGQLRISAEKHADNSLSLRATPCKQCHLTLERPNVDYPGGDEEWEKDASAWVRAEEAPATGGLRAVNQISLELFTPAAEEVSPRKTGRSSPAPIQLVKGRVLGGSILPDDSNAFPEDARVGLISLEGVEDHQQARIVEAIEETFTQWDEEFVDAKTVLEKLGIPRDEENPQPHRSITEFERWMSEHPIPGHYEYRKAWWDYAELVQRFASKFAIDDVRVIGQYIVDTPPPEEKLPMPAVLLVTPAATIALKWDFGALCRWPNEWTVSVRRRSPYLGPTLRLFDVEFDARKHSVSGFPAEWILPPYRESPAAFTCELDDEWDVAALLRLVLFEA